jgi:staphyloferrin B biosynthesis citrate synthase
MEEGCMTLKSRIAAGEPLLGTFLKTPHPHIVEVLATSGLDCICIDAEHAPFDRRDIDACVMAARIGGLPTLVRTQSSAPEQILNALDCGADGVVVPHIRSAEEAQAVAKAVHYGPGGRGYAGSSRAAGYGSTSIPDHLTNSAEKSVFVAQIEDAEALDQIELIAAVDGIDALFIGRIDLTIALGCNSPDDPKVIAACDRVIAAATDAGRPVGLFTSRPSDAPIWQAKGARLFLLGSDHSFIRQGVEQLRNDAAIGRDGF